MALDAERASELFRGVGPVRCRRMFGGTGVYAGEAMFALEAGGALYLKADGSTRQAFEAEGCAPFSYERADGRTVVTSFRRIPDRLLDDPDELAAWSVKAIAAAAEGKARRAPPRKAQERSLV